MTSTFTRILKTGCSPRSWRIAGRALATLCSLRSYREGDSLEQVAAPWEAARPAALRPLVRGDLAIPLALAGLPLFFYPLFPRRCLRRSLVLYRHLVGLGRDPELVVGVKKQGDNLAGHAWILLEGEPVREDREHLAGYTVNMILRRGRLRPVHPRDSSLPR